MFDFNTFHPVQLSGLTLMISAEPFAEAPATFIPADAFTDRRLHDDR